MPFVEVTYPEAKTLAGYESCKSDLEYTKSALELLQILLKSNKKEDGLVCTALWNSSLLAYARCFTDGIRVKVDPLNVFSDLKGDLITSHKYFISLRDKHVAHSVNPFEQVKIAVILAPKNQEKKVRGVSPQSIKLLYLDSDGVRSLYELSCIVFNFIDEKCKEFGRKTFEVASKDNIDNLYKKARPKLIVPSPIEVKDKRK